MIIGNDSISGMSYSWLPTANLDDATLSEPTATPDETVIYTMTATNTEGCAAKDEMTIYIKRQQPLPPCLK
ncbi:MAG: hypothetical protein JKX84_02545 [Flavobacteriales bacterium]|nr:hypothetical protein [Flavobacteriales bacterium]